MSGSVSKSRLQMLEHRMTSPNSLNGLEQSPNSKVKRTLSAVQQGSSRSLVSSSGTGASAAGELQSNGDWKNTSISAVDDIYAYQSSDDLVKGNTEPRPGPAPKRSRHRSSSSLSGFVVEQQGSTQAGDMDDVIAEFVAVGPSSPAGTMGLIAGPPPMSEPTSLSRLGTPLAAAAATALDCPPSTLSTVPHATASTPVAQSPGSPSPRQQIFELQQKVEAERALVAQERSKLDSERSALQEASQRLESRTKAVEKREAEMAERARRRQKQYSELLQSVLLDKAAAERQLARIKLRNETLRLGQIGFERHGATFAEVWQDGWAFNELNERKAQLASRKEQLESAKKKFQKRRSQAAKQTDFNAAEFAENEDMFKVRLAALRRDEAALADESDRLQGEKTVLIRELKRINDEDLSRFKDVGVLPGNRYVLLSLLGRGGFSEVHHAFDLVELRPVACKIHQLNSAWNDAKKENYTKHACREFHIHKSLSHPRIVSLYDVFEIDQNSFCTVLEFSNGGDLDQYLKERGTLPEKEARFIVKQILAGLAYLAEQQRPVIHYDLKPANILFDGQGNVKITDFGLSKVMDSDELSMELTSQGAGTYWYLPPECFEMSGSSAPKISTKVDSWSVGVIFYQMLFGKRPFGHDLSQSRILHDQVIRQATNVEFPGRPTVSKDAKDLIRQLLAYSTTDRIGICEALNVPYFNL